MLRHLIGGVHFFSLIKLSVFAEANHFVGVVLADKQPSPRPDHPVKRHTVYGIHEMNSVYYFSMLLLLPILTTPVRPRVSLVI
ncbi:hypothetical protein JOM56_000764 [Amanita muscaria]